MMTVGIIPARMGSSRFPGKPLVPIAGIPMIGHVYHRSCMARALDAVYVATCDEEIAEYSKTLGAEVVLTSASHERATDRAAEALEIIEQREGKRCAIVVMIQGDEPLLDPAMVDRVASALDDHPNAAVANLMAPIETPAEQDDPNEVKVVVDRSGYALYFSREPIPSRTRLSAPVQAHRQLGLIAFRRESILRYAELEMTDLERAESCDMLRFVEHGRRVLMVPIPACPPAVDVPGDVQTVEQLMATDPLRTRYHQSPGPEWTVGPRLNRAR